jgi:hypothetical protein
MSVEKPVRQLQRTPQSLADMPSVAVAPSEDLSRAVELAVPRLPGDRVRCARVFDTYYRCNWWSPAAGTVGTTGPLPEWSATSLHRIRKSRFLRVTHGPQGLRIDGVAGEESGAGH